MVEQVERFSSKNWKFNRKQVETTSKESSSNPVNHGASNAHKGPLLDTPKDARGMPIDPSPQKPLIKCYHCQG